MQPQEVEVWYVLPALRKSLAVALLRRGLNESEIAKKLGVTKTPVSQCLIGKRAFIRIRGINNEVKKAAENIASGKCPTMEIQKLCISVRKKGLLCKIHKRYDKSVKKDCNICTKLLNIAK